MPYLIFFAPLLIKVSFDASYLLNVHNESLQKCSYLRVHLLMKIERKGIRILVVQCLFFLTSENLAIFD